MLDDPRVNFAISTRGRQPGLDHLGIQVESQTELHEVYARLRKAGGIVIEQGQTACCYAKSEKSWIDDPCRHFVGDLLTPRAKVPSTVTVAASARRALLKKNPVALLSRQSRAWKWKAPPPAASANYVTHIWQR